MENTMKTVTILSTTMVRPTDDTPIETLWLSRLDMMRRQPYSHSHVLIIYQPPIETSWSSSTTLPFFDTDILKESLGKALVPFYTMAGRLQFNKSNGRYEIDCNAQGVIFMEAETNYSLVDLGRETEPNIELRKQLTPKCDYSKGFSSMPLVMVQLTRFKCGGVCLGFAQHHHVADGWAHVLFTNSWARLARGLDIDVTPVHDRFKYVAPRHPPQLESLDINYIEPSLPPLDLYGKKLSTTNCNFIISKDQINILKQEASRYQNLSSNCNITSFTVLAGHIWRSVCKARNLPHDQYVKLYVPVNGRPILRNPKLPIGYTGNAVVCAVCKARAGDIVQKPLWYSVSKVSEAITTMKNPACFKSAIDYIETQSCLDPLIRGEYNSTCPNLWINSWTKMGINEYDFGWGAPKCLRYGGVKFEGQSVLLPTENDDCSLLSITLFSIHMKSFDKYLYEFK